HGLLRLLHALQELAQRRAAAALQAGVLVLSAAERDVRGALQAEVATAALAALEDVGAKLDRLHNFRSHFSLLTKAVMTATNTIPYEREFAGQSHGEVRADQVISGGPFGPS